MEKNFRDRPGRTWSSGVRNRFAIKIAAPVKDPDHGREDKHGRNHQNQNAVAQRGFTLRATRGSVVIAKRTTLRQSGSRTEQDDAKTRNRCR